MGNYHNLFMLYLYYFTVEFSLVAALKSILHRSVVFDKDAFFLTVNTDTISSECTVESRRSSMGLSLGVRVTVSSRVPRS